MSLPNPKLNAAVTLMFGVGFAAGFMIAKASESSFLLSPPQRGVLPHELPKYEGGISLRFAMVDDVLHERFPLHGADYYTHRNAEVQAPLKSIPAGDAHWGLLDDLAVGYVHLGQYDPAIQTMQDKLKQQEAEKISGKALYSTYANLGTAMMIQALTKMLGNGDLSAKEELNQSLDWVQKSIQVNPEAHFGREVWQVNLGKFLLKASDNSGVLLNQDMVGNDMTDRPQDSTGRPMRAITRFGVEVLEALNNPRLLDSERQRIRSAITTVGPLNASAEQVPFDEPTLAIIGMWRYGAGANAHFALALAEIMRRVGQPYIAWDGYERAVRLADGFWPDPEIKRRFAQYCRARQSGIEADLKDVSPQQLRTAFDTELNRGTDYQQAYQKYESEKLLHGAKTDDAHFYDDFIAEHGSIASDPGHADEVFFVPDGSSTAGSGLPGAILGGGILAFVTACCVRSQRDGEI